MSMISGLIDELNKSADEWNGSNMFELARMCRDAADTIWQLRDDLQRANADNAKLRESVRRLMTQRDERLARAETDNAKLRELVRDMYKAFMHGNCYRWCEFKEPCNYISDGKCQWYDRMRELGVEVDG